MEMLLPDLTRDLAVPWETEDELGENPPHL